MIDAGDDRLLHAIDTAVHYVVGLERPEWHLAADMDPDLAVETRCSIFNQASAERIKVFGYHFPLRPSGGLLLAAMRRKNKVGIMCQPDSQ